MPYPRSSVAVIALFLVARLFHAKTLASALPPATPYQRGQFWLRRFHAQATALCAGLAAVTKPTTAPGFIQRALAMLDATGWIPAHRFLFGTVRQLHLGWPPSPAPAAAGPQAFPPPPPAELPPTPFAWTPSGYRRTLGFRRKTNPMQDEKPKKSPSSVMASSLNGKLSIGGPLCCTAFHPVKTRRGIKLSKNFEALFNFHAELFDCRFL